MNEVTVNNSYGDGLFKRGDRVASYATSGEHCGRTAYVWSADRYTVTTAGPLQSLYLRFAYNPARSLSRKVAVLRVRFAEWLNPTPYDEAND